MKQKLENLLSIVKSYDYKTPSYQLVFYCVALCVIGILAIYSATNGSISYTSKQVIGLLTGLVVMTIVALIPYDFIARYYWLLYFINIVLLLLVRVAGTYHGGAKRWIEFAGINFQPSEMSKLMLLIFISSLIAHNRQLMNSMRFFIFVVVSFGIPLILILLEPDLSTTIVISVMFLSVVFIGNFNRKILKTVIIIVVPIIAIVVTLIILLPAEKNIIPEYQYNRLVGFYDPDNEIAATIRYQQENSIIAIGSGGLTGKGLSNNSVTSVKNAEFISEPQTDFIFTIVGEELGFFGSLATIVLLALIVIECFRIGIRARENIGKCIAIGYGTLIGMQAFVNLGVVTMILPNTGLTLPFVSYGLSSLITLFIGIGLVLNVSMKKKLFV